MKARRPGPIKVRGRSCFSLLTGRVPLCERIFPTYGVCDHCFTPVRIEIQHKTLDIQVTVNREVVLVLTDFPGGAS